MQRKRVVIDRIAEKGKDKGKFDLKIGKRIGNSNNFAVAWEMVKEDWFKKGYNSSQLRLQKSVVKIIRRDSLKILGR